MHNEGNITVPLVCDFCLEVTTFGHYNTEPFTLYTQVGFDDKWLVCEICFGLIDRDQWEELALRSMAACLRKQERMEGRGLSFKEREFWRDLVPQLHAKFREFRIGGIVRHEKRRDAEEAPRPTTNPGNSDTVTGS